MNRITPVLSVHHQLLESTQTYVHWVGDAIQPSHPLSSPSPPAPNPSQHQGLFQWVNSSHEVAELLECQLQHQSFQGKIYVKCEVYHFNHFYVYSSVSLSTFTSLHNHHHLLSPKIFHLPKVYPLDSNCASIPSTMLTVTGNHHSTLLSSEFDYSGYLI